MTSWLRKYCNLILQRAVLAVLVCVCIQRSRSENVCSHPFVSSCDECLARGPQCAWCFQEGFLDGASRSERCDTVVNLARKGCQSEFVEHAIVNVEVNASLPSTQVYPRDVRVQLLPGREASVQVQVTQLGLYPVDMYYLVDVSASMQSNLDRLKTVGTALSHEMKAHTSDFRVGFGSFVDKPVSPYINVHPSKIDNPCSDFQMQCRPTHGFIHMLSLTENMTEFTRVIQNQRISANMDTPEGGFDAMMQAVVCQRDVGWRSEARRLLLVMTDQPSHLALDSKLAGIVVPNDGKCHLESGSYMHSANMEYPTLGQLAEKLLENGVYSIFAVEHGQYKWYEDIAPFLPGAYVGRLQPKASNLKELVVQAYKKLLSDVELEVEVQDQQSHWFQVDITAVCPEGSVAVGANKCSNVQANQTVFFNITVSMKDCPSSDDEILIHVRPVGFNETTAVRVRPACRCRCTVRSGCQDEPSDALCSDPSSHGDCRPGGTGLVCSGRGACVCGRCVCHHSALGAIYGKHCQLDDFSCPYLQGQVCAGRGQCVLGECACQSGWTGDSCECPVSTETCVSGDGRLCSGRGRCVCGRCECDDPRLSGRFCEKCPTCENSCRSHWKCVDCHLSNGFSEGKSNECNGTCSPVVDYVHGFPDATSEAVKLCLYPSSDLCHYRFHMDSELGTSQLHISRSQECLSSQRYYPTFIGVFLLTVVLGLLMLVLVKLLLTRRIFTIAESPMCDVKRKDSSYVPTANEKTVTYRRDQPLEMHIQVHKMPLDEAWQ